MIAQPEKSENKASKLNAKKDNEPWNGRDFYVNLGEGKHRNWNDCQRYRFISGGSEEKYNRPIIKLLSPGSRVFVYIPQTGYVGVGLVTHPAVPVRDFKVLVNWIKTVSKSEAYRYETGLFTNQNIVCQMKSHFTIERLSQYFELDD
ncbi:hypothetical protein ACWATR_18525 [Nostoc sp. UIC 10890]